VFWVDGDGHPGQIIGVVLVAVHAGV